MDNYFKTKVFNWNTFYFILYNIIYNRCRNHDLTWDVIQQAFESFLKTYQERLDELSPNEIKKLLVKIAINVLNRDWQRKKSQPRTIEIDADDYHAEISDSSFDADAIIQAEEQELHNAKIQAKYDMACESLTPELLLTFQLRFDHGLSFRLIGEKTNVTENCARQRYHQARAKLAKFFVDFKQMF